MTAARMPSGSDCKEAIVFDSYGAYTIVPASVELDTLTARSAATDKTLHARERIVSAYVMRGMGLTRIHDIGRSISKVFPSTFWLPGFQIPLALVLLKSLLQPKHAFL